MVITSAVTILNVVGCESHLYVSVLKIIIKKVFGTDGFIVFWILAFKIYALLQAFNVKNIFHSDRGIFQNDWWFEQIFDLRKIIAHAFFLFNSGTQKKSLGCKLGESNSKTSIFEVVNDDLICNKSIINSIKIEYKNLSGIIIRPYKKRITN